MDLTLTGVLKKIGFVTKFLVTRRTHDKICKLSFLVVISNDNIIAAVPNLFVIAYHKVNYFAKL